MTVSESERQRILADEERRRRTELSDRMRKLGRSRSPKKRRAAQQSIKKALEARWGKPFRTIKAKRPR
jgi:hypothetical protein